MSRSLKKLRNCLQCAGSKILDKAIPLSGLQAALCARYGYGLTVRSEDEPYFFHLPDIAADSRQTALLREAVLPDEESLLRLRRRTRPGMTIVEACVGCGARSIFYAKSMRAGRVYALGGTEREVSAGRKNILLNGAENAAQVHLLNPGGNAAPGALDSFCRERKFEKVDLLSLDGPGLALAGLESAKEILRRHGPAIILWGQSGEEAAKAKDFLDSMGYAAPEAWTSGISFWMSRL